MTINPLALPLAGALVSTVVAANLLVTHVGIIGVGFGLMAPAGVLVAGLAFTLRDLLHEAGGKRWVLAAIAVGALVSLGLDTGRIAIASAVAFALSELLDLAVYTPLRKRNWLGAVTASGIVGLVVDSYVFLAIAFGSLAFLPGQIVGKGWVLLATVALLYPARKRLVAA